MERRQVLLAGGIGSGKSEVGRLFAQHGACVIDADRLGHEVLEPEGAAFGEVSAAFPSVVADGRINRVLLADLVFADPASLRLLESLTHPTIRDRIRRAVQDCESPVVVVELPLSTDFLGPGWLKVVVDAPPEIRVQRAIARGMDPDDVVRRMSAQPPREQWRDAADVVLDNSGDLRDLAREVDRLWAMLTT